MFAFTADHYPILGESPIKGLWSAVGTWLSYGSEVGKVIARWMTEGDPGMDVGVADINRFHDHQSNHSFLSRQSKYYYEIGFDILHPNEVASSVRNLRLTPYHERTEALGAHYIPLAGYETPYYFESNAPLVEEFVERIPRRYGYDATAWSPIIGAEHLALLEKGGLVDWSASIGPIEVTGHGSVSYLQYLCTNEIDVPVGAATYTLILSPRGTVKRDVTVARLDQECFWLMTGESNLPAATTQARGGSPPTRPWALCAGGGCRLDPQERLHFYPRRRLLRRRSPSRQSGNRPRDNPGARIFSCGRIISATAPAERSLARCTSKPMGHGS